MIVRLLFACWYVIFLLIDACMDVTRGARTARKSTLCCVKNTFLVLFAYYSQSALICLTELQYVHDNKHWYRDSFSPHMMIQSNTRFPNVIVPSTPYNKSNLIFHPVTPIDGWISMTMTCWLKWTQNILMDWLRAVINWALTRIKWEIRDSFTFNIYYFS